MAASHHEMCLSAAGSYAGLLPSMSSNGISIWLWIGLWIVLQGSVGATPPLPSADGGLQGQSDLQSTRSGVGIPPEVLDDPLMLPHDFGGWLGSARDAAAADEGEDRPDAAGGLALETVARPIDDVAKTPWNTPAFANAPTPGIVLRQRRRLPWGLEAEWCLGVAAATQEPGTAEITDASRWSIRKSLGNDLYLYLHDRGSGFVKYFGDRLSVFGRYTATIDQQTETTNATLQLGAARRF